MGSHQGVFAQKKKKTEGGLSSSDQTKTPAICAGEKGLDVSRKTAGAATVVPGAHAREERKQCPMDLRSGQLDRMERVRRVEPLTVATARHGAGIAPAGVR